MTVSALDILDALPVDVDGFTSAGALLSAIYARAGAVDMPEEADGTIDVTPFVAPAFVLATAAVAYAAALTGRSRAEIVYGLRELLPDPR